MSGEGGAALSTRGQGRGKCIHMKIRTDGGIPICLQMGSMRRQAYIMAHFKIPQNCNGTHAVSREVVVRFKYGEIIMAQIQLTLK